MRDEKLDVMRFIGLAMIILAHVNPPEWIFQIRNFDVPLMVMISGVAFGLSYKGEIYSAYVWKRVKRLLFPAWLFLAAYFLLMYLFNFPKSLPAIGKVTESFLLMNGIGYVWIIRVFLMMALLAPFIHYFTNKYTSDTYYLFSIFIIYTIYEFALFIMQPPLKTTFGILIENTVLYVIPYAIIFSFGLRFSNASPSRLLKSGIVFCLIFTVIAIGFVVNTGGIVYTQGFKYPPQLYYVSYALAAAFIIWSGMDFLIPYIRKLFVYPFVEFIARNSLWAYLWHIPFIDIFAYEFYYQYPLVFLSACTMTYLQITIISKVLTPKIQNERVKRNLKVLFTG